MSSIERIGFNQVYWRQEVIDITITHVHVHVGTSIYLQNKSDIKL